MSGAGVGIVGTGRTGGSTGSGTGGAADRGRRVVVAVGLLLLVLGGHRVRRQHDKVGQRDVGGAATLERDRVLPEVLEHLGDGGKPEVLYPALAQIVQGHAQVFRLALEVEREHELALAGFALPHQEHTVTRDSVVQHQLGRLGPGQRAVEPGILAHHRRQVGVGFVRRLQVRLGQLKVRRGRYSVVGTARRQLRRHHRRHRVQRRLVVQRQAVHFVHQTTRQPSSSSTASVRYRGTVVMLSLTLALPGRRNALVRPGQVRNRWQLGRGSATHTVAYRRQPAAHVVGVARLNHVLHVVVRLQHEGILVVRHLERGRLARLRDQEAKDATTGL